MNIKRIRILFFILIVLTISYICSKTYSYYVDEVDKTATFTIADWVVKINGQDITQNEYHTFSIDDLEVSPNPNTNGKFSPGDTGSFTIVIDPSESKVAIEYDVSMSADVFENDHIVIDSITSENGNLIVDNNGVYHGVISKDEVLSGNTVSIDVVIKWIDEESNNENDTKTGSEPNKVVDFPINIAVRQLVGE